MRVCAYCKQSVNDEDYQCRYCAQELGPVENYRWYLSLWVFIPIFICFGPLALPLLWFNPRITMKMRCRLTVLLLVLWAVVVGGFYFFVVSSLEATTNVFASIIAFVCML